MARDEYYEDEFFEDDPCDEYGDSRWDTFLREQLAHTPWWAISLSVHLFVILVVMPMIECKGPMKIPSINLKAAIMPEPEQPLEDEPDPVEANVTDPESPPVPDAVESDLPPSDHHETADDEEFEKNKGQEDARSDVENTNKFNNDALGAGASAGGKFGGRLGGRRNLVKRGGGRGTQDVMLRGLRWLADHQSPSGRWDGDGFQARCKKNTCSGVSKLGWVDPGLTGLATMAFLSAGNTHRFGHYKETVKRALRYLVKIQAADGLIGGKRGHYVYNHALCTLALAEAYGMSDSPLMKNAARKAVEWLIKAQNPGMGWKYTERSGKSDISVTGWCVMALKSARMAGLEVPGMKEAFKGAEAYVESITDSSYYITGYETRPPDGWQGPTASRFIAEDIDINTTNSHASNHTPTALATMSRIFFGYEKSDPRLRGGASVLATQLPVWDVGGAGKLNQIDYYYWYYGTLAMFQMGGEYWKQWNKSMKSAVVDHQRRGGDEEGSWDPIGAWGFAGGRVYATAINVLTLTIYYRYPKAFH